VSKGDAEERRVNGRAAGNRGPNAVLSMRPRCAAAMPGLIEPSCSSSPHRVRMERLPLFLPASNGDFRDAVMIVGDDQCIFSSSWQASLVYLLGPAAPL
jgi:hypothetical protein